MDATVTAPAPGANSEVGTLRTVMVHRPDLAHERLSHCLPAVHNTDTQVGMRSTRSSGWSRSR